MENIAHAFAGLLVARAAVVWRKRRDDAPPGERFARQAAWVSALANNVPDGDLVLTPLTGGKLGYLVHHRGHTHTLVIGVVLGLLVAAAAIAIARLRGAPLPRADARWLLGLGVLGPMIHIGMDGWNVYGVHPFWPFDKRWFYGDAVFILEPLLWLAAAPFLFRDATSRVFRGFVGLVAILGLVLPWLVGSFVPLPLRLSLLLFAGVTVGLATRVGERARAALGLGLFFSVPVLFFSLSGAADRAVRARLAALFPTEVVADVAISSWPANPLCWSAVAVTTTEGGDLVLRRASFALEPGVLPVASCPSREGPITAPLAPVDAPGNAALRWEGEHRVSLARLRQLVRERCDVAALARFFRAPFLAPRPSTFVLGDLRFDRDEALDFAEVELPLEASPCPRFVPDWEPPRAAELDPP